MHATDVEGVEFAAYQLKDVAYQCYDEWDQSRGDDVASTLQDDFSSVFADLFFSQELREAKAKEFVNLKQGNIFVKEYALKFHHPSPYAPMLMSSMRT